MAGAIYDLDLYKAAGIDPRSLIPARRLPAPTACEISPFKTEFKFGLQNADYLEAINRFEWSGLPPGITGEMIERILFYRGQGIIFYVESLKQFFFLPYAPTGSIDCYGRFSEATPVVMGSTAADAEDGELKEFIPGLTYNLVYDWVAPEQIREDPKKWLAKSAVILRDYTNGLSQNIRPRAQMNDVLLDAMSDCFPLMRTALVNSTGITGVKVGGADEQSNVLMANIQFQNAAMNGQKYIPMLKEGMEMQEISDARGAINAETYMMAYQSLDNIRLGWYGLPNGGVYNKRAHILESEQALNCSGNSLALQDGLYQRQHWADIVGSIWGYPVTCTIREVVSGVDRNLDGELIDNTGGQEPNESTEHVQYVW